MTSRVKWEVGDEATCKEAFAVVESGVITQLKEEAVTGSWGVTAARGFLTGRFEG